MPPEATNPSIIQGYLDDPNADFTSPEEEAFARALFRFLESRPDRSRLYLLFTGDTGQGTAREARLMVLDPTVVVRAFATLTAIPLARMRFQTFLGFMLYFGRPFILGADDPRRLENLPGRLAGRFDRWLLRHWPGCFLAYDGWAGTVTVYRMGAHAVSPTDYGGCLCAITAEAAFVPKGRQDSGRG